MGRRSFSAFATVLLAFIVCGATALTQETSIGREVSVPRHLQDGEEFTLSAKSLVEHGRALFTAVWTSQEGGGRPLTKGTGNPVTDPTSPLLFPRNFNRISAPDANSCAGCHNDPAPGGAGDIVANVFVLAQTLDPVNPSVSGEFSNERNTLGMNGAGLIEMLAREMSAELIATRNAAVEEAKRTGAPATRKLLAKGVSFGLITARPDGSVDTASVAGVNPDLIIRPFHQKGVVVSLREFSNNAFNHHHGMQSVERFGSGDPDADGVASELTAGDITAVAVWQAALNIPGQIIPSDPALARAIIRGERTFGRVGCAECHVPELELSSGVYSEPNPFNPVGNLRVQDVLHPFTFDLATDGPLPRPERAPDGRVFVRAFTDLKRHDLCDEELDHYCNEKIVQAGVSTRQFLTRKLWDAGNTAPYGHHGDLTMLTEAIYWHGGEARRSRNGFFALSDHDRAEVIEFLKSLQILPEGTPGLVVDETFHALSKAAVAASVDAEPID